MSRNESGDDDIMRDAVSLVRRIECRGAVNASAIVAGFNSGGWLFVYSGEDPMYRFDSKHRLRRAFVDGLLYRTEGQTLAQIQRQRYSDVHQTGSTRETTLLRRDLSTSELEVFRLRMMRDIAECISGIRTGEFIKRLPVDDLIVVDDIVNGLRAVLDSQEFLAPAIVRRART